MKLVLIHDEMLNDTLPVFTAHADASRVFVLDPAFIECEGWTLKRVQFIVDCVAEMQQVRVFHGALSDVCHALSATSIVTQTTPNHAILRWLDTVSPLPLAWHEASPFVQYDGKLTRFTAYWKTIASQWFSKEDLAAESGRVGEKRSRDASAAKHQ
ncbi:MAG: hypothetical protein ACRCWJ_13800 [Casimicrobium sp.]